METETQQQLDQLRSEYRRLTDDASFARQKSETLSRNYESAQQERAQARAVIAELQSEAKMLRQLDTTVALQTLQVSVAAVVSSC